MNANTRGLLRVLSSLAIIIPIAAACGSEYVDPVPGPTPPPVTVASTPGLSTTTFEVNGLTRWCAYNESGVWCDG